jgi:hypothetical protein
MEKRKASAHYRQREGQNDELYLRRTDLFKEDDPWEALPSDEYIRAKLGLRRYDPADELSLPAPSNLNQPEIERTESTSRANIAVGLVTSKIAPPIKSTT